MVPGVLGRRLDDAIGVGDVELTGAGKNARCGAVRKRTLGRAGGSGICDGAIFIASTRQQ
jgi:hypothetical protein